MDFRVPVTVCGRTRFEKGHYCTEKCMRIHHPGFFIVSESVGEICQDFIVLGTVGDICEE
jgi:hypothetical protein